MSEIVTVGLDLAKNVFQLHGADASGRVVLEFLAGLLLCTVAMGAARPAAAPTTGVGRSASWATRCG